MPYAAEVKRALEHEAQMQNVARSISPYRMSPREVSRASPQADLNPVRYCVPPGTANYTFQRFFSFLLCFLQVMWFAESS